MYAYLYEYIYIYILYYILYYKPCTHINLYVQHMCTCIYEWQTKLFVPRNCHG